MHYNEYKCILLLVCLSSGPATDDKHFCDCLFQLVLSTSWVLVALTKYWKAFDNVHNGEKSESGLGLTQL